MAIVAVEKPILSRIDRLDHLSKQLEEIRGLSRSIKSSSPSGLSTPSSWALTSYDHSDDTSPTSRCIEKHCRSISNVIVETEVKGSLVERAGMNRVYVSRWRRNWRWRGRGKGSPARRRDGLLKGGGAKHKPGSDALV